MYKAAGIVRVTALAENSLGYDATTLYLHVTGGEQVLIGQSLFFLCLWSAKLVSLCKI